MNTAEREVGASQWQICSVLGTEIEFLRLGSGQPLVLIDGAGGFRPDGPFAGDLAEDFTVVALRLPGFGDMVLPGWINSIDDYAYLGKQAICELGLTDVVLVGTSLGGWIAAEIAAMDAGRLSGLVLVDPFGLKAGPMDRLDVPDVFSMTRPSLEALVYADPGRFRFDPASSDDRTLERMARGWETMALVSWDNFFHNPKLSYRLAGIDLPSLILRGASDGLVSRHNAETFASLIQGARYEEIEGCGHLPMVECPRETGARVVSFASSIRDSH